MATKKTPKTTAIVPWEQEMAERAAKSAKAEKVSALSKKIGTRGGILSVDDTPMEDNELRVVVIGSIYEYQYYDKDFDPARPTVPVCYSFGDPEEHEEVEDAMVPHPEAEQPQGEDGACKGCWANQMGSADKGRGKACKNIRRLAVVTEDALESVQDLLDAETRMLNVPVMSTKNWAKYVNMLNEDMQRPYWGVVTTIKLVPDPKSQFQVTFRFEELINFDSDMYDAMKKKLGVTLKQLLVPYPKQADLDAQQPAPRGRGRPAPAAKKTGAKTAAKKGKF